MFAVSLCFKYNFARQLFRAFGHSSVASKSLSYSIHRRSAIRVCRAAVATRRAARPRRRSI
jgi:hypothetical protein